MTRNAVRCSPGSRVYALGMKISFMVHRLAQAREYINRIHQLVTLNNDLRPDGRSQRLDVSRGAHHLVVYTRRITGTLRPERPFMFTFLLDH
jgi:hypothetical protein